MARLSARARAEPLLGVYEKLHAVHGSEHWHWYPEHIQSPLDVIAGAVLVQHTTWQNAERALEALRAAGALDERALLAIEESRLQALIRVSGTPAVKAKRLRAVASMLVDGGGLAKFLELSAAEMRARLLATHGIGEESADAILLYAAGHRAFVIDAYTRRLFGRLGLGPAVNAPYVAWQRYFDDAVSALDVDGYRRYHAYIVLHGKQICRPQPRCDACPLLAMCPSGAGFAKNGAAKYQRR